MLTFDFCNPAALPPARTLLRVLRLAFHRDYAVVCFGGIDSVNGRRERTRDTRSIEVELYADASGLELAFFGCQLVFGVDAKWGTLSAART